MRVAQWMLVMLVLASFKTKASLAFVRYQRFAATSLLSTKSPAPCVRYLTTSQTFSQDNVHQDSTPLAQILPPFSQYSLPQVSADIIPLLPDQRLLCIGDVHGDLSALKQFLEVAQVYDRTSEHWIGGNAIVVQCGDVLDRGTEELACFELLANLSRQAESKGGKLILLYGNHEALNAVGLFHYAYEGGNVEYEQRMGKVVDKLLGSDRWRIQYAGNQPARWATHEPGGLLGQVMMKQMKVAVQVGNTLCVHAGLTKEHLEEYGGIAGMNKQVRDWIETSSTEFRNAGNTYASVEDVIQHAEKRGQTQSQQMPACLGGGVGAESPVWMRDYSNPANTSPRNPQAQQMIDAVLQELQCDRMVMGHTPQRYINAALEGKAWRIDVGASRGVAGGTPEVLEVVGGDVEQVNILTKNGRVPAAERQSLPAGFFDYS